MNWTDLAGKIARAGAPALGTALGGPVGGALGGAVGGMIADAFGVEPTPEAVSEAIDADPAAAEKLQTIQKDSEKWLFDLEKKTLAHMQEMAKLDQQEGWFAYAWRPAGMWLNLFLWLVNGFALPVVNTVAGIAIPLISFGDLVWFTSVYAGLYMGGHTVKAVMESRARLVGGAS